jgi:hypothetical protein
MALIIKDCFNLEKNKERDFMNGLMVLDIMENGLIISTKDLEPIFGMMVENIKVNGLMVECKGLVCR